MPTSPVIAEKGRDIGGGLKITKMGFRQLSAQEPSVMIPGGFQYYVALEIEVSKGKGTYGGKMLSNRSNPPLLMIHTDSSGAVSRCGQQEVSDWTTMNLAPLECVELDLKLFAERINAQT